MSRSDRRHAWLMCGIVVLAGLLLMMIVDVVVRHPHATLVLVVGAWAFTREVKPFEYLARELRWSANRVARFVANGLAPGAAVAVCAVAVGSWLDGSRVEPWLLLLFGMYVSERAGARMVRRLREARRRDPLVVKAVIGGE